jgi:hypothetical protein
MLMLRTVNIGAPRNAMKVKFHKTYLVTLEPVRRQEAQFAEAEGDEGTMLEHLSLELSSS